MDAKEGCKVAVAEKTHDRLARLGFKSASSRVQELAKRKHKMMIAGEFYRIVRQEKIDAFNKKLMAKTMKNYAYDQLSFTPIEAYADVPPPDVLEALELAQTRECFDTFEIGHIVKQVKVPDPLLFGRINGCPDRFFIAQWDDDVKIEDILAKNEG